jgi:ribosomal protein S17
VEIAECRPYSKNKRWRLLKILGEAVETQEA